MSLTTEEYERLRMPLLKMLAEAQAQYQRNIEPIRAQLKRLAAVYAPSPVMIMDMSQIDPEVLGRICGTTPPALIPSRVTDLPDPPHSKCVTCMTDDELGTAAAREPLGLSQGELACASAVVCTCARYDQRCPLHP